MPRINMYIRKEDWDKWEALPDKPAWLHKNLNLDIDLRELESRPPVIIKTPKDVPRAIKQVSRPSTRPTIVDKIQEDGKNISEQQFQTCKEGHPLDYRGKCFDKKCKYSK